MKTIRCHECLFWLPDEDICNYSDMPPCNDYLYEKQRKKAIQKELNKRK